MAEEDAAKLRGHINEEGELVIDEDAILDDDAAQALADLEVALADEAEVSGYNFGNDQVVIDVPEITVKIAMTPVDIDPGPINIMGPMVMIGMMKAL